MPVLFRSCTASLTVTASKNPTLNPVQLAPLVGQALSPANRGLDQALAGESACPTSFRLVLLLRQLSGILGAILELRLRVQEYQVHSADGPVTLFGDDQLR